MPPKNEKKLIPLPRHKRVLPKMYKVRIRTTIRQKIRSSCVGNDCQSRWLDLPHQTRETSELHSSSDRSEHADGRRTSRTTETTTETEKSRRGRFRRRFRPKSIRRPFQNKQELVASIKEKLQNKNIVF